MADHTIEVKMIGKKWKVRPIKPHVDVDDNITFKAPNNTAVRMYFAPKLFGGSGQTRIINIPRGGSSGPLRVRETARDSTIPFAVICLDKGEWATGNSYPRIITDP